MRTLPVSMSEGGIALLDRSLILPRGDGGLATIPSLERVKALAKRWYGQVMAQLGNSAESDLLLLFFNNTAMANVGNAGGLAGSSGGGSPGSLFVTLHTSTGPGAAGTQNTNEYAYNGHARVGVARSGAGWTITGSSPTTAENAAAVTFPQANSTGTPETETYFSVGQETSGAGELYWFGTLTASLVVNNLITPSFATNALQCTLL